MVKNFIIEKLETRNYKGFDYVDLFLKEAGDNIKYPETLHATSTESVIKGAQPGDILSDLEYMFTTEVKQGKNKDGAEFQYYKVKVRIISATLTKTALNTPFTPAAEGGIKPAVISPSTKASSFIADNTRSFGELAADAGVDVQTDDTTPPRTTIID